MSISDRKKSILLAIIKEYIKNVQPVSSGMLVDRCKLEISSATVRNEMAELEEEGYIFQPHTSAGRIPTELAYKLFVEEHVLFRKKKDDDKYKKVLDEIFDYNQESFKKVAKKLADISGNAIFWAFHKNDLYYTGISNLFIQPEFKQSNVVCDVSIVIDRMEEIIADIFDKLKIGENVFIGSENPFGQFLSSLVLKYEQKKQRGVVGIMGPLRMDYEKNLDLINYLKNKLQ